MLFPVELISIRKIERSVQEVALDTEAGAVYILVNQIVRATHSSGVVRLEHRAHRVQIGRSTESRVEVDHADVEAYVEIGNWITHRAGADLRNAAVRIAVRDLAVPIAAKTDIVWGRVASLEHTVIATAETDRAPR